MCDKFHKLVSCKYIALLSYFLAEDGYRQTVALAEILARNISNVEARLNQLSLTKDRSIGIINQKGGVTRLSSRFFSLRKIVGVS